MLVKWTLDIHRGYCRGMKAFAIVANFAKSSDDIIWLLFATKWRLICHWDTALKISDIEWLKICKCFGHDSNWQRSKIRINLNKSCTNHCSFINFCKILQKHRNSAAKGKFHGLAQNSTASGKLWALHNKTSLYIYLLHIPYTLHGPKAGIPLILSDLRTYMSWNKARERSDLGEESNLQPHKTHKHLFTHSINTLCLKIHWAITDVKNYFPLRIYFNIIKIFCYFRQIYRTSCQYNVTYFAAVLQHVHYPKISKNSKVSSSVAYFNVNVIEFSNTKNNRCGAKTVN